MFPIKCKDVLPVHHVIINSIQVRYVCFISLYIYSTHHEYKTLYQIQLFIINHKRGGLGPLTVWVSNDEEAPSIDSADSHRTTTAANSRYNLRSNNTSDSFMSSGRLYMAKKYWTKIYEKEHKPSFQNYEPLDLSDNAIILKPGQVRGIYIHSSIQNDSGIVYDNQQHIKTYEDNFITIMPGRAHVSTKPFGTR